MKKALVKTVDTDVMVLAISCFSEGRLNWLWVEFGSGKSHIYIPIHVLSVASWCLRVFVPFLCVCFCTRRFVMVSLNLTCLHCVQHFFCEHLLNLYYTKPLQRSKLKQCFTAYTGCDQVLALAEEEKYLHGLFLNHGRQWLKVTKLWVQQQHVPKLKSVFLQ